VDTRSGAITPGRVIAIRGDTIVAIGDSTEVPRFRARRYLDRAKLDSMLDGVARDVSRMKGSTFR